MRIAIYTDEARKMIRDVLEKEYFVNESIADDISHDIIEGLKKIEDD